MKAVRESARVYTLVVNFGLMLAVYVRPLDQTRWSYV